MSLGGRRVVREVGAHIQDKLFDMVFYELWEWQFICFNQYTGGYAGVEREICSAVQVLRWGTECACGISYC